MAKQFKKVMRSPISWIAFTLITIFLSLIHISRAHIKQQQEK